MREWPFLRSVHNLSPNVSDFLVGYGELRFHSNHAVATLVEKLCLAVGITSTKSLIPFPRPGTRGGGKRNMTTRVHTGVVSANLPAVKTPRFSTIIPVKRAVDVVPCPWGGLQRRGWKPIYETEDDAKRHVAL